ncbi:MAG: bifunctional 5,10-methylenetetrahydrofolate dehydrogenase/5,10-methenyltetrahydrofolate cyclohydrolase [Anaerolineales bacterium]|nr:bifunctional 5,10-methylenetetrahydrofolate dehydrogenase/5,10-methenyltetrahydrofolate cyclohydrolase [Anaerolineales bacterium]
MPARILDGLASAARVQAQVAAAVDARRAAGRPQPGLAMVVLGDEAGSQAYLRSKRAACAAAGIASFDVELPAATPQRALEELVAQLNADPRVHGIIVQLPLPAGLDEERVLAAISLEKDVDGFHPVNIGRLAMKGRQPLFVPCTPAGCLALLEDAGATFRGARAVVLGRSNIVGLPAALLLLQRDATVTVCHSRSADLPAICRTADILIAAVGRPEMVKADWVKPGAYVIDVGVNLAPGGGERLVGDVAFDEVKEVAGAITPVPGGVGSLTVAMLLRNTLRAAELADAAAQGA